MKHLLSLLLGLLAVCVLLGQSRKVPLLSHPASVQPQALDILNSEYRETNLSMTPDGRYLYFMSGRGGQEWSKKYGLIWRGKREYDGDIWYSEKGDGQWQEPQVLSDVINSGQGEDEPNISPDGQTVRFQSWRFDWAKQEGPYFESTFSDGRWSKPQGMGGGIHQFFKRNSFATDGMYISPNDEYFIVAAGHNYDGRLDLYLSKQQEDGAWTYPRPMSLNTKKDERSIFIAGDSKTLYFASDGYGGMGGLDIFKGVLQADGTVTDIVNIGAPFNTKEDDYGFLLNASGSEAYFIREGDIYFADLEEADPGIRPGRTLLISGVVQTDQGEALASELELVDPASGEVLATARSGSKDGRYALAIAWRKGPLILTAQPESYYSITESISPAQTQTDEEVQIDFLFTEKLRVITRGAAPIPPTLLPTTTTTTTTTATPTITDLGESFVLLFDSNCANVQPQYAKLLKDMAALQKKYADIRLALFGHTDSNGDDGYNLDLSYRRVMSVARCLQLEGAERERLWWDFCGESKPIADNEQEFGRADNRRVELRIVRVEE